MRARFLYLAGLAAVFICVEALGAVQGTLSTPDQLKLSDYYADFSDKGLDVHYAFSGGVGTLSVSNHLGGAKAGEGYTSGALSAGTHGQGHPGTATAFTGYYTLNATISQNAADANQWEVTGGSFSVQGDLFHIGDSTHQKDLLLNGTLGTGKGSFDFDSTQKELEFLLTGTGGDSSILADFMGAGTGSGLILPELWHSLSHYSYFQPHGELEQPWRRFR